MNARRWSLAGAAVAFAGAGAVAVGTWLPWLTVHPGYGGPVPAVYLPGMDAGLAGLDWLALVATAVGVLGVLPAEALPGTVPGAGTPWPPAVTIVAGGFVAAVAVVGVLSNNFLGTFVPDVGFYLTVLGGVHLSVGGSLRLYALAAAG